MDGACEPVRCLRTIDRGEEESSMSRIGVGGRTVQAATPEKGRKKGKNFRGGERFFFAFSADFLGKRERENVNARASLRFSEEENKVQAFEGFARFFECMV